MFDFKLWYISRFKGGYNSYLAVLHHIQMFQTAILAAQASFFGWLDWIFGLWIVFALSYNQPSNFLTIFIYCTTDNKPKWFKFIIPIFVLSVVGNGRNIGTSGQTMPSSWFITKRIKFFQNQTNTLTINNKNAHQQFLVHCSIP